MSAYITLSREALEAFLQHYAIGRPLAWQAILNGIINSNYCLQTEQGEFVLTLFESQTAAELPPYLALMTGLAEHGLPCPRPLADCNGKLLGLLHDKPTMLTGKLPGASVNDPTAQQCFTLGAALAKIHQTGQKLPALAPNPNGLAWFLTSAEQLCPRLDRDSAQLLSDELAYQIAQNHTHLPQGLVHGDLFRDNVLFEDQELSGLLDWYDAFVDAWLYDVAVTINDWCVAADGALQMTRYTALLEGYNGVRLLNDAEQQALPAMLRAAALRFWLSRLLSQQSPRSGHLVQSKDPDEFKRILLQRR